MGSGSHAPATRTPIAAGRRLALCTELDERRPSSAPQRLRAGLPPQYVKTLTFQSFGNFGIVNQGLWTQINEFSLKMPTLKSTIPKSWDSISKSALWFSEGAEKNSDQERCKALGWVMARERLARPGSLGFTVHPREEAKSGHETAEQVSKWLQKVLGKVSGRAGSAQGGYGHQ